MKMLVIDATSSTCSHRVKVSDTVSIHVSVGTVYQCIEVLSLSDHHYHHDRRKNGNCELVKKFIM